MIAKVKDYLHKLSPNVTHPDELLLRLCYAGNFMMSEVTEKIKAYDEWH